MKTFQTSANYTAYVHPRAGLIIESTRKAGGVRLAPEHPQYADWLDAFETAIDTHEADALCRALLG
jgi:hypothetical protein